MAHVTGITIDDKRTRDIDDAIEIRRANDGWQITVSIADVGRVIAVGSPLDELAKERAATRYYASGNSPMLPRYLAEDQLSLWPNRSREVLVVDIILDRAFDTYASILGVGTLRSRAKLAYSDIPGILNDPQHALHEFLTHAKTLGLGLLAKRRKQGALVVYDLNNGWVTTEEGFIKKFENKDDVIGYIIIQELMILANSEVARLASLMDPKPAMLFRNHTARAAGPDLEALARTIQEAHTHPVEGIEELRKRTHAILEKATYGAENLGHVGLNIPAYLHFTSPIRRYADVVNHQQIRAAVLGRTPPYTTEQVSEIAQHLTAQALQARQGISGHMKAKAEDRARRAVDARRLDGLDARSFERVVKVEARGGEEPSPAFAEAWLRRLAEGTVPVACMTVVFGEAPALPGWAVLRAAMVQRLVEHPEDAVTILAQGSQMVAWPAAGYEVTAVGPAHLRVFRAKASLGDHQAEAMGKTSKEAKQRASVGVLAALAGLEAPKYPELSVPVVASPPEEPLPVEEGNFVGLLQEYAQKRGGGAPAFSYTQTGPANAPVFSCTCLFRDVSRTAVGASKKDAKQRAAKAVYNQVRSPQAADKTV